MAEARKLTNAERCSLFLSESDQEDLVAKVFDDGDGISAEQSTVREMRIPIGKGIAGHVKNTGQLLNIRDAYSHPLFYREIDKKTGFKTRNILCFPIRDKEKIIGVAQLCNKKNDMHFDVLDEQIASAFSICCGISIMNSTVYRKMQARSKLSNEIMMYHMKVEESDVQALLNCTDDHSINDYDKLHFNPRKVSFQHMPCYIIKMFTDLGFFRYWRIKKPTLARFILCVKKGYRDTPYHNWTHAFCVSHFAYLLLKNMRLVEENYMTPCQALGFFVSCLCHDIDHRGTSNSFQTKCDTLLASAYSCEGGSVMENHHLAQTICVLNTDGYNIFEDLSDDEYHEVLDLLRNNILATDLSAHFLKEQEEMIGQYNRYDPKQQKTLFGMLMNCCDLSDLTKEWKSSKKTAVQIYREFFSQGDLEKRKGTTPLEMMDQKRAFIPDLQIKFLTDLVIPLFTNLSLLFPSTRSLVEALERNRSLWKIAKNLMPKEAYGEQGIEILSDPNFVNKVLDAEKCQC